MGCLVCGRGVWRGGEYLLMRLAGQPGSPVEAVHELCWYLVYMSDLTDESVVSALYGMGMPQH